MNRKLLDFLGLKRNTAALLGMVILVGMGERMAERFLPIYLLALGGGALSIGYLNGTNNLLNAIYSFIGGYASDRVGYKRALLFFNLLAIFGYVIVIVFPYWQAVIVGSIFFLSWTAISLPATMDLVAKNLPSHKRTMGVSMHSLVRRIPMGLGPIIGGTFMVWYGETTGVRIAFGVAIAFAIVALVVQQRMIEQEKRIHAEKNPLKLWTLMSPELKHLLLSDILIRFCEQIPYAFVVVWSMKGDGVSAIEFGVLTAIEMATSAAMYIPTAYLADRGTRKPFVIITFWFFTLFPLVLLFSHTFVWLVVAFIIRGLKEFGEPTRKALILELSPENRKAGMFGVYYLVRDVIVSVAAFVGAFLWEISPEVNFLTAFAFGAIGSILFMIFGRDVAASQQSATV
ncbi:MAG: MFS transporter [Bacteroidota bacterium]|nr:MFS transporter [Bacteroidota bacterium]